MNEIDQIKKRFSDLFNRASRDTRYCFTDFLSEADISVLQDMIRSGQIDARWVSLSGGFEGAERQMARFGNEDEFGWSEDFPIRILKISPVLEKFGEELSHRDYLGSLMALNIERDTIGDIRIAGTHAWVCVVERLAPMIMQELDEVRHTHVVVEETDHLPEEACVRFQEIQLIVASPRADAVIARLTGSARSKITELFREQRVFINGRLVTDGSTRISAGDSMSIRGWGRVLCDEEAGQTRKGHIVLHMKKFI